MKEDGDFEGIERSARRLSRRSRQTRGEQPPGNALLCLGRFAEAWERLPQHPTSINAMPAFAVGVAACRPPSSGPSPIRAPRGQGLGDVISFCASLPPEALGHRLAFWGDPKLHPVMGRSGIFEHFRTRMQHTLPPLPVVWAGASSRVPRRDGSERISPPLPLDHDPGGMATVRSELARFGPPPYVGLTWRAGSQRRRLVLSKEIEIDALGGVLKGLNATFVSLQRRPAPQERERLAEAIGAPVHDVSAVNDRLEDALAWLALLDEYVGVSNTNTHLRACAGRDSRARRMAAGMALARDAERSRGMPATRSTAIARRRLDRRPGKARADLLLAL